MNSASIEQDIKPQADRSFEPKLILVRADTLLSRARGLLGQRAIASSTALWLKPCASVHTFGMQCPIGVFFIDQTGGVIKTLAELKPNRFAMAWQATSVVETAAFALGLKEVMEQAVIRLLAQAQLPQTQTHSLDKNCNTGRRHR